MSTDTVILGLSALIGPSVAVAIGYLFQRSLLKQQRELQSSAMKELEESRRAYEKARTESEQKLWLNWKAADRDRFVELTSELKKIAKALDNSTERPQEPARFR